VIYLALVLIVLGVALFVAAPLFESVRGRRGAGPDLGRVRLEHERALAVAGLRELEFDREMHKLSEQDWSELKQQLEARALRAMAALEKLEPEAGAVRTPAARKRPVRVTEAAAGSSLTVRFCPACGKPVSGTANFCGECGASLAVREVRMTR
jgi:zinc-ribbon domain